MPGSARRRFLVPALLALCSIVLQASPSPADIPLFRFTGFVRDIVNRPLQGATVSDQGGRSTVTAADGSYTLPEYETGDFTLTASRPGTLGAEQSVTVNVPIDRRVDFNLRYIISAFLSRTAITTAGGPGTTTMTVETGAIDPGVPGQVGKSCVYVLDSRTGQQVSATYAAYDAVRRIYQWTHEVNAPINSAEGTYTLTYSAKDCANGTILTATGPFSVSYVIDNTVSELYAYEPQDLGNCLAPCQDFRLILFDSRSGLDASSTQITVTSGGTIIHGPAVMNLLFSTTTHWGFRSSTSAPLALGDYVAEVTSIDRAGNALQLSYSFRVLSASAPTTLAHIDSVPAQLSAVEGATLASFANVILNLDGYTVSLSSSRHSGFGMVTQRIALGTATVNYTLADGTTHSVPANTLPAPRQDQFAPRIWHQPMILLQASETPVGVQVQEDAGSLGRLQLLLPLSTTAATIAMAPVLTDGSGGYPSIQQVVPASACPNCPQPLPLPGVDPLPIFNSKWTFAGVLRAKQRALDEATRDYQDALLAGTAGVGFGETLPGVEYFLRRCSENQSGDHSCEIVAGSVSEPDENGDCPPHTVCVNGQDPRLRLAPQDFTTCSQGLPCASPESPLHPTAQSDYEECDEPNEYGLAYCTEDHANMFNGFYWPELHSDPNYACQGAQDPDSGRHFCQKIHLFSQWGDSSRRDIRDEDGFQAGYRSPDSQQLSYVSNSAEAWVFRRRLTAYEYCDDEPGFNYSSSLNRFGTFGQALSFNFALFSVGPNGDDGPCEFANYGGQIESKYWLKKPGWMVNPNGPVDQGDLQMEYEAVFQDSCDWKFTGISAGSAPPFVTFNYDEVCETPPSNRYQLFWHYNY